MKLLFVCTGNICRSATADGVLRHKAAQLGIDSHLQCDSAGTHGYHIDERPDSRAIRHAARRGYDLGQLRARKFHKRDFAAFDLILAMDSGHLAALQRLAPDTGVQDRLRMFLDFAPNAGLRDVPDPYYGDDRDFELMLDLIESGVDGLIRQYGSVAA